MAETVKIQITIQHDEEVDTELTVAEWNALTEDERNKLYVSMWETAASNGSYGGHVTTDGARGI